MNVEDRAVWRERRRRQETRFVEARRRSTPLGERSLALSFLKGQAHMVGWVFRALGLYRRGMANAARLRLEHVCIPLAGLPPVFDGFTILFLSDLHVGLPTGVEAAAIARLREAVCDVAVIGGDVQSSGSPRAEEAASLVAPLLAGIRARSGTYAVLGNHDRHDLVEHVERLGVRYLINEAVVIERGGQSLTLAGCDDVHAFHDDAAGAALRLGEGCRIAVVHSPDYARQAAAAGCSLYLAGHTHGGQICRPGGRPVLTALDSDPHLASGRWRIGGMEGFTSRGLGCASVPLRFNCPPEMTLITLRRAMP